MIKTVLQAVLRFFGALASALTGLGALCTAAGFLAERTRWSMLGLGSVNVDLNEYLFTGSRFLAVLPSILLTTALALLTGSGLALLALLGVISLALATRPLLRTRAGNRARRALGRWLEARRAPLLLGAPLALAFGQFVGCLFLFRAAGVRNLLFLGRTDVTSCVDAATLADRIRMACDAQLDAQMGAVFLIVLGSAALFWLILRSGSADAAIAPEGGADSEEARGTWRGPRGSKAFLAINAALLSVQLVLLPINYGALFLGNEFPVVEVIPAAAGAPAEGWPADGRFFLLQRRDDEFYLFSRPASRVWLVPREALGSVAYLGICRIFGPAPGSPGAAPCPSPPDRP